MWAAVTGGRGTGRGTKKKIVKGVDPKLLKYGRCGSVIEIEGKILCHLHCLIIVLYSKVVILALIFIFLIIVYIFVLFLSNKNKTCGIFIAGKGLDPFLSFSGLPLFGLTDIHCIQDCKIVLSSRLIMNSRWLWNKPKSTSSLGLRHLGTF